MEERTLKFASIIDLLDFEAEIRSNVLFVNRTHLTIIGKFNDGEIQLAKKGYNASEIDNDEEIKRDTEV
jgi:hypothetical protein